MARTKRERERQAPQEQGKTRRAILQYDLTKQTWLDEGDPFLVAEMTSVLNPQSWQVLLPPLRRQFLLDRGIHLIAFHCETRGQHWEGNLHDVLGRVFEELFIGFKTESAFDRYTLPKKQGKGSLRVECLLSRESVAEAQPPEQVSAEEAAGTTAVPGGSTATSLDSPLAESADALTLDNESETGQDAEVISPEDTIKTLVSELIPTLTGRAEETAETIIALNRTLNQTYWQELRGVAKPLIKSLLEDIPADYEGKRRRSTLINALLTALDLGIVIHDQHGRPHVCSAQASQARPTDDTGNFRLRRRTASDGSQRTFPLPSLDQVQIKDTPHQARGGDVEAARQ